MTPRVGVIARCDDRGLGNQTWEVCRGLRPDKILVVRDPGSERQGFPPHRERFPGSPILRFNRDKERLDENVCRDFLDGLDVVYSAETYYDWNFCEWATDMAVATVLHTNPEFYFHWAHPHVPKPAVWWSATAWRSDHMPADTHVVPMPVPIERWEKPDFSHKPRKVLHVGGLEAILDRNGTKLVAEADRISNNLEFVVTVQGADRSGVKAKKKNVANYWDLYNDDCPIMVMPRRFGGLCLPAIEAIGAGKLVAMPDVSPNRMWPILPLPCKLDRRTLDCQSGVVSLVSVDPKKIVDVTEDVFDTGAVSELRRQSYEWATQNSWETMRSVWMDSFAASVEQFLDSPYRKGK